MDKDLHAHTALNHTHARTHTHTHTNTHTAINIYRIRQIIRGGKLLRLDAEFTIRWKKICGKAVSLDAYQINIVGRIRGT